MFDEALVERVELADDDPIDTHGGVNKRFRPFEPGAVVLVPPSLDKWLTKNQLARFIDELTGHARVIGCLVGGIIGFHIHQPLPEPTPGDFLTAG
ncbi:hypothetical protein [Arthrobacter glacialis]|uniref:hypothetical protein n=1 Tax=Arthrobacter glacialis TaxID=1664 RepID=UPI000CD3D9D0|nr:hypothetical protein [Arthrobacter glacialis]POH57678.1 hypothetical protein CVS28_14235 [Arthrobacter glacialis]